MSSNNVSSNTGTGLENVETSGSILMTKELFEKLYLSPHTTVAGDFRKRFANPTPLGLAGFLLALTPLSCCLMGWDGAGRDGEAVIGSLYFLGGLLAILTSVGEFLLGNAFSMITFGVYGGFFLAYAATLQPSFNAFLGYDTNPLLAPVSPGFLASFAYLLVFMALFNFIMFICAFRTNLIFVLVFASLEIALALAATSNFYGATGDIGTRLQTGIGGSYHFYRVLAGIFGFIAAIFGWYQLLGLMFEMVDFPIQLPVGDLSRHIKGYSERRGVKKSAHDMA